MPEYLKAKEIIKDIIDKRTLKKITKLEELCYPTSQFILVHDSVTLEYK